MSENATTIVALDAHGGDRQLDVSVPATFKALEVDPELRMILVGDESKINDLLASASRGIRERISIKGADSIIPMDAKPKAVLRQGKNSSMWNAFELVAEGEADACISGGSTAAMMVLGVKLLGTLPGKGLR